MQFSQYKVGLIISYFIPIVNRFAPYSYGLGYKKYLFRISALKALGRALMN